MNVRSAERRYLARDLEPELEIARTAGSFLFEAAGRKYMDFMMGWCVGNFGWSNPDLSKRIERFKGPDYVYPGYSYKPWVELASLLASIAPGQIDQMLSGDRRVRGGRCRAGSDAAYGPEKISFSHLNSRATTIRG
jgi:adenosylmethionine-8-amino-7-oxononanoate aminotransferase